MHRTIFGTVLLLAAFAGTALAQASAPPNGDAGSDRKQIENALSAAPAEVAAHATVVAHDNRVLRAGTNGWVCMPDMPEAPNNAPMCLDEPWQEVIDAWVHKRAPVVTRVGVGYMLQDDLAVSNTDPFATAPAPGNQWLENSGPHVMIFLPDAALLESVSTDPRNGGPYVMWKGTPYAHIMVPAPRRTR